MDTMTGEFARTPDTATIFGVDVAGPDPAALAASQQAFQDLRTAASQARIAAAQATDAIQGQYAHQIAAVADAAARGDASGLKDGVNGALAFVAQHPGAFGTPAAGFATAASTALGKIETAIQLIDQAHDASSAADAIDASANAVEATGTWVGVAVALISGGPVAAGILVIAGFLAGVAHAIANLIRPDPATPPADTTTADTSTSPGSGRRTTDNQQTTDQQTKTDPATDQQTGNNLPAGNKIPAGTRGRDGSPTSAPGGGDDGPGFELGHGDPSSTSQETSDGSGFGHPELLQKLDQNRR